MEPQRHEVVVRKQGLGCLGWIGVLIMLGYAAENPLAAGIVAVVGLAAWGAYEYFNRRGAAENPLPVAPPILSAPTVPAGWLPDPTGQARLRYWDGEQWTEHIAT